MALHKSLLRLSIQNKGYTISSKRGAIMRLSVYFSLFITVLFAFPEALRGEVPRQVSFGGAGRAGVSRIALFSNPASAAFVLQNRIFYSYSQTRAPNKGKNITLGMYDITNPRFKGGLSYTTEHRPQSFRDSAKIYNRRIIRALGASRVVGNLFAGLSVHYVMDRTSEDESRLFYTNIGAFYPILRDVHLGLTFDNIFGQREEGRILGLGLRTSLGVLSLLADVAWPLSKIEMGETGERYGWSIATEVAVFSQLKLRKSWFWDVYRQTRGEAMGFSWEGPRADIEYATRETRGNPTQKDHILGINIEI